MSDPTASASTPGDSSTSPKSTSNGTLVVGVAATGMAVATVATALRLYTRRYIIKQFWIDDYMAILSWLSILVLGIANCLVVRDGLGTPPSPGANLGPLFIEMYIGLVMAVVASLFVKLTFMFHFYRILRNTDSRLRMVYMIIMCIITVFTIAQVFVTAVPCIPMAAFFDRTLTGNCIDDTTTKLVGSVGSIITDFIILLLPIPVIWRLNLPARQKWALAGVFGIGSFACVVSVIRLAMRPADTPGAGVAPGSSPPPDPAPNLAWAMAEVSAGLLAACLSTIRPLIRLLLPSWRDIISYAPSGRTRGESSQAGFNNSTTGKRTVSITGGLASVSDGRAWTNISDNTSMEMNLVDDVEGGVAPKADRGSRNTSVKVVQDYTVERT